MHGGQAGPRARPARGNFGGDFWGILILLLALADTLVVGRDGVLMLLDVI